MDHFTDTAVNQFVHIAYAHYPPVAVRHTGEAIDHCVIGIGTVRQRGQGFGVLRFQPRVQQLLLRVVDNIALLVHEKTIAPLADAYIINIG